MFVKFKENLLIDAVKCVQNGNCFFVYNVLKYILNI